MAYIFEAQDGAKYVLDDKPIVGEDEDGQLVVDVVLYVEPVDRPAPEPPATSPDATGDSGGLPSSADLDAAAVDKLAIYREHNGPEPHADPAMRCQCADCKEVSQ